MSKSDIERRLERIEAALNVSTLRVLSVQEDAGGLFVVLDGKRIGAVPGELEQDLAERVREKAGKNVVVGLLADADL